MTNRQDYIAGLRQLADWLELNPDMPVPADARQLVSLPTNHHVVRLAEHLDTDFTADHEGNCAVELRFGPIRYRAFAYTNLDAHLEAATARNALRYADTHGLTLVPRKDTAA